MPVLITDFLSVRTLNQLQNYCTDVVEDEQVSAEIREEARRNLVMLNTITKPASPTTLEDDVAVKARAIDFLIRTHGQRRGI